MAKEMSRICDKVISFQDQDPDRLGQKLLSCSQETSTGMDSVSI